MCWIKHTWNNPQRSKPSNISFRTSKDDGLDILRICHPGCQHFSRIAGSIEERIELCQFLRITWCCHKNIYLTHKLPPKFLSLGLPHLPVPPAEFRRATRRVLRKIPASCHASPLKRTRCASPQAVHRAYRDGFHAMSEGFSPTDRSKSFTIHPLINRNCLAIAIMFLLLCGIGHNSFQRTLANCQRAITGLPFKVAIASVHVIHGKRACAFQVANTIGDRQFRWNGNDQMNMVIDISGGVDD